MNSLLTFYSGQPFTVYAGRDVSLTQENNDRVNVTGNPFAGIPSSIPNQAVYWFNPAAFAPAGPGT